MKANKRVLTIAQQPFPNHLTSLTGEPNMTTRTEHDLLGEREIPTAA